MDDSGSVERHYQRLLAPVYAWMIGDPEAAFARSREALAAAGLGRGQGLAVDLGAGFGLQAIPLAVVTSSAGPAGAVTLVGVR
jgi:hypothetical protein